MGKKIGVGERQKLGLENFTLNNLLLPGVLNCAIYIYIQWSGNEKGGMCFHSLL